MRKVEPVRGIIYHSLFDTVPRLGNVMESKTIGVTSIGDHGIDEFGVDGPTVTRRYWVMDERRIMLDNVVRPDLFEADAVAMSESVNLGTMQRECRIGPRYTVPAQKDSLECQATSEDLAHVKHFMLNVNELLEVQVSPVMWTREITIISRSNEESSGS